MKVVVLAKHVPEPTATWSFQADNTLARDSVEGRLSELDEYAVEQAVRLKEGGTADEVVVLTVGPAKAVDGLRKALAMGADRAVHVSDDAIAGSDALGTSKVLAAALENEGYDLVLTGMASTDAEMSVMPSMVAARLGLAQATFAGALSLDGGTATIRRDSDAGTSEVTVPLPAVISLTDQTDEARYPAFKAIMMAKKKPVETRSLADLGVAGGEVGLAAAATSVLSITPTPQRQAGVVVTDEGDGAGRLADFLASRGFLR
jgi:electron transfer flavoprotein beta subunit